MLDAEGSLFSAAGFEPRSLDLPDSWVGHMPFIYWLVSQLKPRQVVELGTHTGNSYFSICQSVSDFALDSKCYAVDTWEGDVHAGIYGNEIYAKVESHNSMHYKSFSRLLRMTFDEANGYFSNESIDLLHIDGLHTYEAVKHDYETWLGKVAPGGVILFHDTNVRERNFGVWQLWEELTRQGAENFEFVHSHGLGVLRKPGGKSHPLLDWFFKNGASSQHLRDYFSALGAGLLLKLRFAESQAEVLRLGKVITQRDVEIDNLKVSLSSLDDAMSVMMQSRSWRLTAPLRAVGQCMRCMRKLLTGS